MPIGIVLLIILSSPVQLFSAIHTKSKAINKGERVVEKFIASGVIKGKVTDSDGLPVPGAAVKLAGASSQSAITDINGNYSFTNLPAGSYTLTVSFIGFTTSTQQVTLREDQESVTNVVLTGGTSELNEVVVVGYGTRRRADLTGSVGSVSQAELQERPAPSLNQQLSGRIPGVQVNTNSGRPGGQTTITVRGFSSISNSNNPLYVVDGVMLPLGSQSNNSNAIDFINPADIVSVDILKDASATAIYGARGANGVIMITTKKGSRDGGRVTYDADFSVPTLVNAPKLLNSREFMAVEDLTYQNAAKYDPAGWASGKYKDPKLSRTNPLLFDASGNPLYDTNWFKESTQSKLGQNHTLAFSNGNENGSYAVSLGYRDDTGILLRSWLKRYSGRFAFDSKIKNWLKVDGSLSYNVQDENLVDQNVGGLNALRQMVETIPLLPLKYPDGTWAGNKDYRVGGPSGLALDGGENPVNILQNTLYSLSTQNILGNVGLNITLNKDLEFRSVLGSNIVNRRRDEYNGKDLVRISKDQNGRGGANYARENFWSFENYLTYNKRFAGIHALNAMLGMGWNKTTASNFGGASSNYTSDYFQNNNFGAGITPQGFNSNASAWTYHSAFTRLNYTLKDKYLFTFTGRLDGSSKFGYDKKYAFFPSGAFAWKASEENFLKDNKVISNLKLRTSYGQTGNSEVGPYSMLAGLGNNTVVFNNAAAAGVGIGGSPANPLLQWEGQEQVDAGLELGLFNNRISLEADVYLRKSTDMILSAPLPRTSGYGSVNKNIGDMENRGIEFAINTVNIKNKNFSWNTTFNIAGNKNKVTKLATAADFFPGPGLISQNQIIRVGEPVGALWGYVRLGTWGTHEAAEAATYTYGAGKPLLPGDIKLQDINKDGKITADDQTIIGNVFPKAYGSLFNTFRYKNLDLLIDIQYSVGADLMNMTKHSAEDRLAISNSYASVLNAWTPTNQNTPIAEMRSYYSYAISNPDSHWVEDASFIRGRNLVLSYNFPGFFTKKLHFNRFRMFTSVQNFFLADRTTANDPEVSTYGDRFAQGMTFFDYPKPRTFMLGLNIGL